jgi:histidinol-phosphate/aromatic aminotransferase/cobyric acid decarboxylase-like protein
VTAPGSRAGRAARAGVPPPGAHGGDGARVAAALGLDPAQVVDLSANLNPFAPDVAALAARHLDALGRYPDVAEAEAQVADLVGVHRDRLVLTGGSAQAIALVAEHVGAGWVDEPDFSLYGRHLRLDPAAPRWRSDPHSPSGRLAPHRPPGRAAPHGDGNSTGSGGEGGDGVGVWDEAYLPLAAGTWTRGRPGWALGSLTKAYACPGLRIGFALAPTAADAEAIRARRPAWAVGGLACALVPDLAERADPGGWTARMAAARRDLVGVLRAHGRDPLPSDAPWVLVAGAEGLRDGLARQGVVVRDCASFGLPGTVRIAVPGGEALARLDRALARL